MHNVKFNALEGSDKARIQISLTRLPNYLYPIRVDSKMITDPAVGRFLNNQIVMDGPKTENRP